jgi:putative spermidine/putrescine transport system ATP-binding protein
VTELTIKNIQKKYNTKAPFSLQINSLEVQEGEFFALLGPSGCGKTTLLKLIAGLIAPDQGEVFFKKQNVTKVSAEKRGFGMVFQTPLLFPHMTIEENVAFGLKMKKIPKQNRVAKARDMLEKIGLPHIGGRSPVELSGGQKQRVAFARALITDPPLLLMDEPFSSLDPVTREEMRSFLSLLHKTFGVTILFVTHDPKEAFVLADRIAVMENGEILQVGKPQELYENPQARQVALILGLKNVFRGQVHEYGFQSESICFKSSELRSFTGLVGCLVMRPDGFKIAQSRITNPHKEKEIQLEGVVGKIYLLQGFAYVTIGIGIQDIEMILPAKEAVSLFEGEKVMLIYQEKDLHFIPDSSFNSNIVLN